MAARRRSHDSQWPADFSYRLLSLLTPTEGASTSSARAVVISAELTGPDGQREWTWALHPIAPLTS